MAYRNEPEEPVSVAVAIIVAIVYVAAAVLCALCFLTTDIVAGLLGKIISSLNEASL